MSVASAGAPPRPATTAAMRRGGLLGFVQYRGFGIASGIVAFAAIFFFVYPLLKMLWVAFVRDGAFSAQSFVDTYHDPDLGPLLLDTFVVTGVGSLLAMLIATVKALLICLFFMHMLHDKPLNVMAFLSSIIFMALFIGLALSDYGEYKPEVDAWDSSRLPQSTTAPAP